MRLGLEAVQGAFTQLGRPTSGIPAIHVVGTNGKGSVSALAAHALKRPGRRVGCTTSPHLHRVGERVAIDGVPASEEAIGRWLDRVLSVEPHAELPRPLTFFEVITLAALVAFAEARVDAMVVEAGLGGRLDATRVVQPSVTAITSIAFDHAEFLGDTLAAIAGEKAAVIRPGIPVVCAPQVPEVAAVVAAHARRAGAPLHVVTPASRAPRGLVGAHQATNAAVALAAARVLDPQVTAEDLDDVQWPGRLESVAIGPGTLVLDVAHNAAGIDAVVEALLAGAAPPVDRVVVGCMADKDAPRIALGLRRLGVPLHWTAAADEGAHPAPPGVEHVLAPDAAWPTIARWLRSGERVLACGSFRLVGAIRAHALRLSPPEASDPVPRPRP